MSTPKAPKKDANTIKLEEEQLAAIEKKKEDEEKALERRKDSIKRQSLGRRSLLRTSETGIKKPKPKITAEVVANGIGG